MKFFGLALNISLSVTSAECRYRLCGISTAPTSPIEAIRAFDGIVGMKSPSKTSPALGKLTARFAKKLTAITPTRTAKIISSFLVPTYFTRRIKNVVKIVSATPIGSAIPQRMLRPMAVPRTS